MALAADLQFTHAFFEVADILTAFANLGIETLLDGRVVGGLAHRVRSVDELLLPLDLMMDIADQLFVVHGSSSAGTAVPLAASPRCLVDRSPFRWEMVGLPGRWPLPRSVGESDGVV